MSRQRAVQPLAHVAPLVQGGILQRKCACGQHTGGGECAECRKKKQNLQRKEASGAEPVGVPPIVQEVLRSPGQPLDPAVRAFLEPRFAHDFSQVRIHRDEAAMESAREVNALAYTVGSNLVFGAGQYAPETSEGRRLMAHELAHVVQQGTVHSSGIGSISASDSAEEENADRMADSALAGTAMGPVVRSAPRIQRRAAPYIKKVTVHLAPKQNAHLDWEGTPPATAPGSDDFTVSTGKGYSDPGDPRGTCTRSCCSDPMTQCAPPWNQPSRVGACCTYYGNSFWTGTPLEEHNTWKWWTPIQPYYSSRGIALHQHYEVTGQPIGHGCVRMEEPNAKRIHDYSNGRQTNVTIDGRAAPVQCDDNQKCGASGASGSGSTGRTETEGGLEGSQMAFGESAVPGLEGVMS